MIQRLNESQTKAIPTDLVCVTLIERTDFFTSPKKEENVQNKKKRNKIRKIETK